ncbi:MAG: phosphoribosyltransferase [Candidatus Bathyarchaeota archaeon B26-2]|nr:MAG: phosphoribosyltransferase [Candidatus Bathyarchaeota archaeon B26-2]
MGLNLEFEVPSWDEIYCMLLSLAERIRREGFQPDVIVGVSRGGWPPARVMSDLLENPELANVRVEFYTGVAETKSKPVITQPLSVPVKGRRVLIMDDVADTGKSLLLVRDHVKENGAAEIKLATIYYKPWSVITPDYYIKETRAWIVFPWERKETVRNMVKRCRMRGTSLEEVKQRLIEGGFDRRLLERFIQEVFEEG